MFPVQGPENYNRFGADFGRVAHADPLTSLALLNHLATRYVHERTNFFWNQRVSEYSVQPDAWLTDMEALHTGFTHPPTDLKELKKYQPEFLNFLTQIDQFLAASAYLMVRGYEATEVTELGYMTPNIYGNDFQALLRRTIPEPIWQMYIASTVDYLHLRREKKAEIRSKRKKNLSAKDSMERAEIWAQLYVAVGEMIIRSITSYAIWESIRLSEVTHEGREQRRAVVAAVAMDFMGKVVETGYRAEKVYEKPNTLGEAVSNYSWHAEHVLLYKLEQRGIDPSKVIIGVSMEPCRERSDKHTANLGGDRRGCASRLMDAGVPVVGYALDDGNPKNKGNGRRTLDAGGALIMQANNPAAEDWARSVQTLEHFDALKSAALLVLSEQAK